MANIHAVCCRRLLKLLVCCMSLNLTANSRPTSFSSFACSASCCCFIKPPPPQPPYHAQVNLVVVSSAAGVDSGLKFSDFLVSGVLVVTEAFLQLLYRRRGVLSQQDWDTSPRWLLFGSGEEKSE